MTLDEMEKLIELLSLMELAELNSLVSDEIETRIGRL